MVDYLKCLNPQGNISTNALYIQKCNAIPSSYLYQLHKKKINMLNIDDTKLKETFPNLEEFWLKIIRTEVTTSAVDDLHRDDDSEDDEDYIDLRVNVFENGILWDIGRRSITCLYTCSTKELETKIKEVLSKLLAKEYKPKEAEAKLVAFDGQCYYTIASKIKETHIKIEENYNDDFLPVHDDVVKFLNQRESGLIILNGSPGVGKTFYIRHLISQYPKEYVIVTNSIAGHLAQPEFVSFMLEHKDSVFILEDCEQILMDRSENTFGNAITNILNMSDGLMSDIFNVKFICTFNADISKIDSALLRKGRCYARYEFGKLTKEKVENFCKTHKIELPEYKEMKLGDIYNHEISNQYSDE